MDNSYTKSDQDGLHVQSIERTHSQNDRWIHTHTFPASPWSPHTWLESTDTQKECAPKEPHHSYYGVPPKYESNKQRRIPFGLSPWVFATLIALITAVVVGGAVGGGVAAAMGGNKGCSTSSNSNDSSTGNAGHSASVVTVTATMSGSSPASTSTGKSTNYSPVAAAQVETLLNKCSDVDARSLQSPQGSLFKVTCDQQILGSKGASGVTIGQSVQYTLQDCVNTCSLMNYWKDSVVCAGITWNANMAFAFTSYGGGNCWMFSNVSNVGPLTNVVSAVLVK